MIIDPVANRLSPAPHLGSSTCGRTAAHTAVDGNLSDKTAPQPPEDPPPPYTPVDPAQLTTEGLDTCPPAPTPNAIFNQFCRCSKGTQFIDRPTTSALAQSPGIEEIYEGAKQLLDSTVALVEGIIFAIGRCVQALGGCLQGIGKVLAGIGLAICHRRALANTNH